ncbi:MAG: carboxypeptidase regulatory-like domain-containing protein [Gemmatimonadota bacterium]|nr:carboxypeptidase regulatory-like domain-containing protein [Gemmatimonadota bacterium]
MRRPFALAVCIVAMLLLAPVPTHAQEVRGRVVDPAGEPLDYAELQVLGDSAHATSGAFGGFDLGVLAPGVHLVQVRRIGFRLVVVPVTVPTAGPSLTITMTPVPVELDTVHTRLLEQELPRLFQRMNEHLGAAAFGPDLMKKYPGYSLDEVLRMDWPLWRQLGGGEYFGCGVKVLVDGREVPPPLGTDWGRKLAPSYNKSSADEMDLGLDQQVAMRDVAAVEVFNSPDFVHEPEIDAKGGREPVSECTRIVLVWTNGYQQRKWAGH